MLKYTSISVNNVKSVLYCKGQKTISGAFGLISQQHMAGNRKTSASVARTASRLLKTSSSQPVKKVSGSALSQRAPKRK